MKRLIAILLCRLVFLCVFAASLAANTTAQVTTAANFRVETLKQIREGVDAWPLIVNPSTLAAQRINETLTRQNSLLLHTLNNCDKDYLEWLKLVDHFADGKAQVPKDWSRKIEVTMTGPRFLSLVATDEVFCGGTHPESDTSAMVFDMTTGSQVNWLKMIDKSAGVSEYSDTVSDGRTVSALLLPALQNINIAAAGSDCKDAFQNTQSFLLWPNAKRGTLVAFPFDLPHVVQACANEINLSIEQARKLGFDESILIAIDQAHHLAANMPKH